MDHGKRLSRAREQATGHPIRQALLGRLGDGERNLRELGAAGLPGDPALSVVAYHLSRLERAELVACGGGLYRAVA